ncbi:MAG: hypothetical protein IPK90_13640 [Chitinophagaceae bacterium]|nr:hypothetical protein [Chitinophagaceae bacterium]
MIAARIWYHSIVTLFLDQPLGFGNYTVTIGNGSDGHTLVDICTRSIPAGETLSFIAHSSNSPPMDQPINDACKTWLYRINFQKANPLQFNCGRRSDFIFTGPQAVTAIPSMPACTNNSTTSIIRLNFTTAVGTGNYQVQLATGTDGNTILNECLVPTPAGATLPFFVSEGVSALFTQSNATACGQQTVSFWHDGNNNNQLELEFWQWHQQQSSKPHSELCCRSVHSAIDCHQRYLYRYFFSASANQQPIQCRIQCTGYNMPGDILELENNSTGSIDRWQWSFSNGTTSNQQSPVGIRYLDNGRENWYTIRLIASNATWVAMIQPLML